MPRNHLCSLNVLPNAQNRVPFHESRKFSKNNDRQNSAAKHWIPLSNTLNIRILQWIPLNTAVDSTKRCSGLRRWPQWNPPLAVVNSTAVFQWNSRNSFNTNLQKVSTIEKKWISCTSVPKSSSVTCSVLRKRNNFTISKCHKKKDSEFFIWLKIFTREFLSVNLF